MTTKRIILFLLFVLLAACACTRSNHSKPTKMSVAMLDSGLMIANAATAAGGQWIDDKEQLAAFTDRYLTKTTIPNKTVLDLNAVDFSTQGVLVIWMGERPTGGYAMELVSTEAPIGNATAQVQIKWMAPDKNAITPQIMTNPYLMLVLNKGTFDSIAVVDQTETIRITVGLTK